MRGYSDRNHVDAARGCAAIRPGRRRIPDGAYLAPGGPLDVAGEPHYLPAWRQVLAGRDVGWAPEWDTAGVVPGRLVPEPTNPRDPHAVALFAAALDGRLHHVGHLFRDDARAYETVVQGLLERGTSCGVQVWVIHAGRGVAAKVQVAGPDVPPVLNEFPVGARFWADPTRAAGVSKHEDHQDILGPLLRDRAMAHVWCVAHPWTQQGGSYDGRPGLRVTVDGLDIGVVRQRQGTRYAPVAADGQQAVIGYACRNQRGLVEVTGDLPRMP